MSSKPPAEPIEPTVAAEVTPTAPPLADDPSAGVAPTPAAGEPQTSSTVAVARETHGAHTRRMAHRTRLHLYTLAAVALLVYVVALATSNTRHVRIDWVFAHSTVPLVWLTLFAAILGWLLGTLITLLFRRLTRAPRRPWPPRKAAPK